MGICSASYGVGSLMGSVLGGFVKVFFGFQAAFLLYFCLPIMATLILANVKVRKRKAAVKHRFMKKVEPEARCRYFTSGIIVSFSYNMLLAIMFTLFPVYAEDLKIEAFWIGVLLAALWLGRVIFFIYAGRLSDTLGRENILIPAVVCLSVASLLIAASSDVTPLFVANLLLGSGLGAAFPVTIALISDVTPSRRKGVMMRLFETFCGIGMFTGSIIRGWIAEIDAKYPYILCGVVCAVCASIVMLYKLKIKDPKKDK